MSKHYIETAFPVEADPYRFHPETGYLTHNERVFMPISGRQYESCLAFLKDKEILYQITTVKIDGIGIAQLLGGRDPKLPGWVYDNKSGEVYDSFAKKA